MLRWARHAARMGRAVEGCRKHGKKLSGSIKCWKILEWLRNWQPFEKGSVHGVGYVTIFRKIK
jgi:hypothetical protein